MCGIFGFSGNKNAYQSVLEGLKRLEYRGYDSWGIGFQQDHHIELRKQVGPIGDATEIKIDVNPHIAIGHTRWATHGGVTEINAHPHFSSDESFILAQNGIVENYQELKKELISKGYKFVSQTDTEVIVRLVEEKLKTVNDLKEALRLAFLDLKGRNTVVVLENNSNTILAIRNGSPLVAGIDGENLYLASDTLSFSNHAKQFVPIENYQMVQINGGLKLYDVRSGEEIEYEVKPLDHDNVEVDKEGYDHFMLKEIVEQQFTIKEAISYTEEELEPLVAAIKAANHVYTVGAGTAGFAAAQIAFFLRKYASIPATELKSYEMQSYKELFSDRDVLIAVSQSGETADTIEAIEFAKAKGSKIASIVNMVGSTITRMSNIAYLSRTGPEICVASTKAFTAQMAWGLLLSHTIAGKYREAETQIHHTADLLENYFTPTLFDEIKSLAKKLKDHEHFFVLGKGQNYYVALEGALKVKEITYKHFEGFPAGELKHGVIALIDKGTPVFVIVSNDETKDDMLSAAAEVKARGGYTIGVAKEENEVFDETIVTTDMGITDPIVNVVPFQLLSYFLAVELGNSPDKPRNLAKSVTVK